MQEVALIADACVLIDLLQAEQSVLEAIARAMGRIHVVLQVLAEVEGLTRERAGELGLVVVDPTTELLLAAAAKRGRLSLPDRVCLLVAAKEGWTCVSNDGPLRRACVDAGVPVLWGLEAIAISVERGCLTVVGAIEAADAIARSNRFITAEIVAAFKERVVAWPR